MYTFFDKDPGDRDPYPEKTPIWNQGWFWWAALIAVFLALSGVFLAVTDARAHEPALAHVCKAVLA